MASKLTSFDYKKLFRNPEYYKEWLMENNSNILQNRNDEETIVELNEINHKAASILRELKDE
jgi:hypothetical protein|tara:strand:- start:427 stop:612 length:186 start_codon:yes stop_codon:yes gene_type:complete